MTRCLLIVAALCILPGCASELRISDLAKIENSDDYLTVSRFRCCESKGEEAAIGLEAGNYRLEYENEGGKFYRGPGVVVKLPVVLNMNKEKYPDSLFEGGVYVPNDPAKPYRIYYYQNNLPGSPGPTVGMEQQMQMTETMRVSNPGMDYGTAAAGTSIGLGITNSIIESSRSKIAVMQANADLDISGHVSKP